MRKRQTIAERIEAHLLRIQIKIVRRQNEKKLSRNARKSVQELEQEDTLYKSKEQEWKTKMVKNLVNYKTII